MRLAVDGYVNDGWGSGVDKGLSAAVCVMALLGGVVDWALKKWFGENPDEKWDSYLRDYTSKLPSDSRREGAFQPFPSFLTRLFHSKEPTDKSILLPTDEELKFSGRRPPVLSRASSANPKKGARLVKFKPFMWNEGDDESDDEDDEVGKVLLGPRSPMKGKERAIAEEDEDDPLSTSPPASLRNSISPSNSNNGSPYRPPFFARHGQKTQAPDVEEGVVPATPSLIKAIQRVEQARENALRSSPAGPRGPTSSAGVGMGGGGGVLSPPPKLDDGGMEDYWEEVRAKAGMS